MNTDEHRFKTPSRSAFPHACSSVFICGSILLAAVAAQAQDVLPITIDTLRADRVGAYGYTKAATPNTSS